MLVDFQTLLAGVSTEGICASDNFWPVRNVSGQACPSASVLPKKHLVADQMGMHGGAQPGGQAVALHDLLYPADHIRSAALRFEQMHLLRVGREVCPEDRAESLRKQETAEWQCPSACHLVDGGLIEEANCRQHPLVGFPGRAAFSRNYPPGRAPRCPVSRPLWRSYSAHADRVRPDFRK